MSLTVTTRRAILASTGSLFGYATWKVRSDPLHLVWDLDNTLICSISPVPAKDDPRYLSQRPSDYFDHIDDDFPYEEDTPNTRTYFRPGARIVLSLCGLIAKQHVFTTAQETYARNLLGKLDPDGTVFESVSHRDMYPHAVKEGKDLALVTDRLDRAILFDDRLDNFDPQIGKNGVLVAKYVDVGKNDVLELLEMCRLVCIAVLAHLCPDARNVVKFFWSDGHKERFSVKKTM